MYTLNNDGACFERRWRSDAYDPSWSSLESGSYDSYDLPGLSSQLFIAIQMPINLFAHTQIHPNAD